MKKSVLFLSSVGLLVFFVGAGMLYVRSKQSSVQESKPEQLMLRKDVGMTEAQKKVFVEKISELEKKLSSLEVSDKTKVDRYDLLKTIANNYFSLGEFEKARDNYLRAAEISRDDASVWYSLASVELQMHGYKSANEHIDIALKIEKQNSEYWRLKLDLATQFLGATDAQVKTMVESALVATETNPDILSYYAKYLAQKGDTAGAIEQWNRALKVNPVNRTVYEAEIKTLQSLAK